MTIKKPGPSLQYDDLISLVFSPRGEILDATIEDFFTLEVRDNGHILLTLKGLDEEKPYRIIIESASKITVRPYGKTIPTEAD
jgi:hypothetical protein